MFKENFVIAVKVDSKILREQKDLVYLPFGTEYAILLKNLEARTASVNVSIDGKDVLDGNSLVIRPEETVELKGFMKGHTITNAFKFIEKTAKISKHRGDFIDDGMIRVEVTYEKEQSEKLNLVQTEIHHHHYETYWIDKIKPCPFREPVITYYQSDFRTGDPVPQSDFTVSCSSDNDGNNQCNASVSGDYVGSSQLYSSIYSSIYSSTKFEPMNEEGITVNGTPMKQDLHHAYIGELEENSTVIVMKLKGFIKTADWGKQKVKKPLTVKMNCPTCGTKCRNAKYCPECGTCLI